MEAATSLSLAGDLQAKTLIISPRPREGQLLEVRFGTAKIAPKEEKKYTFWLFFQSIEKETGESPRMKDKKIKG